MSGTMDGQSGIDQHLNPVYDDHLENETDTSAVAETRIPESGDWALTGEKPESTEVPVVGSEPPVVEVSAEVSEIPLRKYSRYTTKKTIAQGLMDVALLMANASQLKAILSAGPAHEFYELIVAFLIISIILQIITGFILLILGAMDFNEKSMERKAGILNNTAVGMIFLITVVNVFISAFGIKLTVISEESKTK